MIIGVPSQGRASTVTSHRLVTECTVCVPDFEEAAYTASLGRAPGVKVVAHPGDVVGMSAKYNWMLDHLADEDGIFFLDDDFTKVTFCFTAAGEHPQETQDPELVTDAVKSTWEMARQLGCFLFGFAMGGGAIRFYNPMHPFGVTGFVSGGSLGLVAGHGLRFDERLTTKEDWDICLQNAARHRKCWRDERFNFAHSGSSTFTQEGGMALHRTSDKDRQSFELLGRKWGACIGRSTLLNAIRGRDYAGIDKVKINLPF